MSFQPFIDKVQNKYSRDIQDFIKAAKAKGFFKPEVRAGEIVKWLKKDYSFGQGDAMAMYGYFKHLGLIPPIVKPSKGIDHDTDKIVY